MPEIRFRPICRNRFFGLNVKPVLFRLSGIVYFVWRRRVKNALPVTSELYAKWQWNLAHFEINLCWEDINNIVSKWPFNFADISKNYFYCENAWIFHILVFSFNYIAVSDKKKLQIILQSLQIFNWAWCFTILCVFCWCQVIFDFRKKK